MSDNITKEEIIEQFKGNKILKLSSYIVGTIVVVVLGFLTYQKFVSGPTEQESQAVVAKAIMYLEKDSTQLAVDEAEYITGEYDGYKGGELAQYSLGNLYFKRGEYEAALQELEGVEIDDTYLMTLTLGTQGDSYSELGDYQNAVKMYVKAANRIENDVTTPMYLFKAGLNAEEAGDFKNAAKYYKKIKDNYISFSNQKGIDKYITRAENSKIE